MRYVARQRNQIHGTMTAPISIIIPTYNSVQGLGPTLASVFEGVSSGLVCEVIFADGGSSDEIEKIAGDLGAELVRSAKGRGTQMAAGAQAAKGEWLLFLHSDTALSEGWAHDIRKHMVENYDRPGYFRLAFDADGFAPWFVSRWANLRAALFGLPYGDQGLLVSRVEYNRAGGFDDIPLMEDVRLVRRLSRPRRIKATATTSAERYETDGWFRRGFRNLTTLLLYFLGVQPEKLAKRYR